MITLEGPQYIVEKSSKKNPGIGQTPPLSGNARLWEHLVRQPLPNCKKYDLVIALFLKYVGWGQGIFYTHRLSVERTAIQNQPADMCQSSSFFSSSHSLC